MTSSLKQIYHFLPYQVIQAAIRFQQALDQRRSIDADASKRHRRVTQTSWKPKNTSLLYKDGSALEASQKKKSVLQVDELLEDDFLESYHDSSVDKVQFFS